MTAEPLPAQSVHRTAAAKYLTVGAVAQRLGVSKMTIYRLVHEGGFPGTIKVGKGFRVPASSLLAFEENHRIDRDEDES